MLLQTGPPVLTLTCQHGQGFKIFLLLFFMNLFYL